MSTPTPALTPRPAPVALPRLLAPLSPALALAYDAEAAGRLDEAERALAQALAAAPEPYHLARLADLRAARGAHDEALAAWSQARAELLRRGASVRLEVRPTMDAFTAAWHGEQLAVIMRDVQTLTSTLELWPFAPATRPTRRLMFTEYTAALAISADRRTLVRSIDGQLVFHDLPSGQERLRVATDEPHDAMADVVIAGEGDDLRVLARSVHGLATLYDGRGTLLATHGIDGETLVPVCYNPIGVKIEPTANWVTAIAMTVGARVIALGSSDGTIRVIRQGQSAQVLTLPGALGGPMLELDTVLPDRPKALHLDPAGERLVAIHRSGDLARWDLRSGALVRTQKCSPADRCHEIESATFTADGSRVASMSHFRVRAQDVDSDRIGVHPDERAVPLLQTALFAPDGALALLGLEGSVSRWQPALTRLTPLIASPPHSTFRASLSPDGRVFSFADYDGLHAWDLVSGQRAVTPPGPLARSHDGRREVVRVRGGLEIRDPTAPERRVHIPMRASGALLGVAFAAASGEVLVVVPEARGRAALLVDPLRATSTPLEIPTTGRALQLSPDGNWLAATSDKGPTELWSTRTGELRHRTRPSPGAVVFADDSSFLATLESPAYQATVEVHWLDRPASAPPGRLDFAESMDSLTVAGDELFIVGNASLTRWRPRAGQPRRHEEPALAGYGAVALSPDGKRLLLIASDEIWIRDADASLRPLARLLALPGGEWAAISEAGAVDGSDAARDRLVVHARSGEQHMIFTGDHEWELARVPGLVARALAGEDVAPPALSPSRPR